MRACVRGERSLSLKASSSYKNAFSERLGRLQQTANMSRQQQQPSSANPASLTNGPVSAPGGKKGEKAGGGHKKGENPQVVSATAGPVSSSSSSSAKSRPTATKSKPKQLQRARATLTIDSDDSDWAGEGYGPDEAVVVAAASGVVQPSEADTVSVEDDEREEDGVEEDEAEEEEEEEEGDDEAEEGEGGEEEDIVGEEDETEEEEDVENVAPEEPPVTGKKKTGTKRVVASAASASPSKKPAPKTARVSPKENPPLARVADYSGRYGRRLPCTGPQEAYCVKRAALLSNGASLYLKATPHNCGDKSLQPYVKVEMTEAVTRLESWPCLCAFCAV